MEIKARKAVISRDGRSIVMLDKDRKEWRLWPDGYHYWCARDRKRTVVGGGRTIWAAIKDAS